MDKIESQRLKAYVARTYPLEDLVSKYVHDIVATPKSVTETTRLLSVGRFLCEKALKILPTEIDVRGATDVLKAIEQVETVRKNIDRMLKHLDAS